jgi:hypothetical protein
MTRKPLSLLLAAAALVGLGRPAVAQSCSGNPCSVTNTASVTVGTVLKLSLSSLTTTLTSPDTTAFNQGYQDDLSALTATVKANRPWSLKINGGAATWTASGVGARANKPVGDLQWSTSGGAPFTALTTSAATIASGASGTSGSTYSISYRTLWDYTLDTPGTYSLDVVFTATAP